MMAGAETSSASDTGQAIVVTGLFVQIIIFGLFIVVTAVFHRRITVRPTERSRYVDVAWNRYIVILYGVSALIMVRSIFRAVEFIQGNDGELMTNEVYLYVFDTLLMWIVWPHLTRKSTASPDAATLIFAPVDALIQSFS